MCFFQKVTFEAYTSEPRLKPLYPSQAEEAGSLRKQQYAHRAEERARNQDANAQVFAGIQKSIAVAA